MAKKIVKIKEKEVESPKIGRPTKYRPEYCEQLIKHMASGFSYESFAGVLGIFRQTLYDWEKVHEAFLDAKKEGSEKNLYFWESQGNKGLWEETGKDASGFKLNSTVWIFNMKNRHKWKDKQEIEVENKDPKMLEKEMISKMSLQELKELVKKNEEENK